MNGDEIDELLSVYGLFPGARKERAALSQTLATRGFKGEWMPLLWAHVRANAKRPEALLATLLAGPWQELQELVEDLQAAQRGREARGEIQKPREDAAPSHYSQTRRETIEQQAKANNQTVAEYVQEGDEQWAYCRVAAERRTIAETATELGWTEDRVLCAIERWAPYYGRVAAEVVHDADPANRKPLTTVPRKTVDQVLAEDDARKRRQSHHNNQTRAADPAAVERLRKSDQEMVSALDAKFIVDNAAVLSLPQAGLVTPEEIDAAHRLIQTNAARARLEEAERVRFKLYGNPKREKRLS